MEQHKKIENYIYNVNQVIGKGNFSTVYRGMNEQTKQKVAVKVVDKRQIKTDIEFKLLGNEIQVLKKIQSPNVLQLYDVYQTQNNTYIITELCNNGNLRNYLQHKQKLCEFQAIKILLHLIYGLQECFKKQVIHRDLKPENIFIHNGVPKIADFGLSKDLSLNSNPKENYSCGSAYYMSPEQHLQNCSYYASDIWALGVIYYEMLYGKTPWKSQYEPQLRQEIQQPLLYFSGVQQSSAEFLKACFQVDYSKRLNINDALKMDIFKSSQIENVRDQINCVKHQRKSSLNLNQFQLYQDKPQQIIKLVNENMPKSPMQIQSMKEIETKYDNQKVVSKRIIVVK